MVLVEVQRAFREHSTPMPFAVAMSGNTAASDVQRFIALGFEGILGKPFSVNDARAVLLKATQASSS